MKKLLVLAILLGAAQLVIGQTTTLAASNDTNKKLSWKKTTHNFGNIANAIPVTHTFEFTNTTDTPITLDNVRTTCGCTASEWSHEPIAPGATSEIVVSYNAKKAGSFTKLVKVYINGQKQPEILTIKGQVAAEE